MIPATSSETTQHALPRRPAGTDQLNCNSVDCDKYTDKAVIRPPPTCPPDSLPAPLRHDPADLPDGRCCDNRPLVCQCLPCDRRQPGNNDVCGPSQLSVLVEQGRDTPGHCCDVYKCVDCCQLVSYSYYSIHCRISLFQPFDARCYHIKHPVPDRIKPSFVIFDIRALWRLDMGVRVPECQQ